MRLLFRAFLGVFFASILACSGTTVITCPGSDTPETDAGGAESGKDSGSSTTTPKGSLGPQCTAYLACCDDVSAQYPQLAASCDSTRTSIENAQSEGASTASYESSCESSLTTFESAGYCK